MRYPDAKAVILLACAAAIAAGCGSNPSGGPSAASPVTPVPHDMNAAATAPAETAAPKAEATAPAAEAARVVIDNFAYSPREITVAAGTRVTWVNHDDVPHTVTSSAKPRALDSKALDTDDTFSFVFKSPGTYDYFCAVHPHMTAKVIVK
jgi:plastocyanin